MALTGLPLKIEVCQLHGGFLRLTVWLFVVILSVVMTPRVALKFVIRRQAEPRRCHEKMVSWTGPILG